MGAAAPEPSESHECPDHAFVQPSPTRLAHLDRGDLMFIGPLLRIATTAHVLALTMPERRRKSGGPSKDDGLTTLEIVIWGLGLFLAAGAAVGIITGVIQDRTS